MFGDLVKEILKNILRNAHLLCIIKVQAAELHCIPAIPNFLIIASFDGVGRGAALGRFFFTLNCVWTYMFIQMNLGFLTISTIITMPSVALSAWVRLVRMNGPAVF